jgi:hypothetical protein
MFLFGSDHADLVAVQKVKVHMTDMERARPKCVACPSALDRILI